MALDNSKAGKHTVLNASNLMATTVNSMLVSGRFVTVATVSGSTTYTPADTDNGALVAIGDVIEGERELTYVSAPAATTKISALGIVKTPEVIYEQEKHYTMDKFYNEAGDDVTVARLHVGDRFGVTVEGFASAPVVGNYAGFVVGSTKIATSATATATSIGKVTGTFTLGNFTYYAIRVEEVAVSA